MRELTGETAEERGNSRRDDTIRRKTLFIQGLYIRVFSYDILHSVMNRNEVQNILNEGFTHSIKDPLWQNIPMTREIKDLLAVRDVQKLARIRQNGPAYHIYPGAVHTRLSHSIGVYHLGREILLSLAGKSDELFFTESGIMSFLTACLLHDIGHFPYAHSLKELALKEHEEIAGDMILNNGELNRAVRLTGADPLSTALIIDKDRYTEDRETNFYRSVLSGTLDPDKLDYLSRDGFFSGVPYGKQDTDFVIHSLVLRDGKLAIEEEALGSVEQILFSKYMMYRSLYWHKGVRAATAMIKKALAEALLDGSIRYDDLYYLDDNEFNALCLSRMSLTPSLVLVEMVDHNELLERKAGREYNVEGRIEREVKEMESREKMERELFLSLREDYPALREWEVIIDIPEPINFESRIPVVGRDGVLREIRDDDIVFTGEVSNLFQKKLRKTALYLPEYVDEEKAARILERYENE